MRKIESDADGVSEIQFNWFEIAVPHSTKKQR